LAQAPAETFLVNPSDLLLEDMRFSALVLACVACAGHGSRVRAAVEPAQDIRSMKALAAILQMSSPAAAWQATQANAASPHFRRAFTSAAPSRDLVAARRAEDAQMNFLVNWWEKIMANEDYSDAPALYEQTNARVSQIVVSSGEACQGIKNKILAGDIAFDEAAIQFSKDKESAERGGALGKITPEGSGLPQPVISAIFGLFDTGRINPRNDAPVWEPIHDKKEIIGPIEVGKEDYRLIKMKTRHIAEFDLRLKDVKVEDVMSG